MDQQARSIRTEARADFIADHRARAERLTEGELNQHERNVCAALTLLAGHQQPAYRGDVIGILGDLCYDLGTHSSGNPAIYWNPCAESELAEMLMVLGADLQKSAPRKMSSILASVRLDLKRCVLWFELPVEPVCPLEAA